MSRKNYYLSTAAGIAGMLVSAAADASTISYNFSNPIANAFTNVTGYTFLLQKFDTNLGILDSFVLTTTQQMRSTLTITAGAAGASNVFGQTQYSSNLTLPANGANSGGNYNLAATALASSATFATLGANIVTVAPTITKNTVDFSVANGFVPGTGTVTDSTLLADFSFNGTGNIGLGFGTNTSTGIFYDGGNASATQSTRIDVDGQIVYTYHLAPPPPTGAPEPMTAAVLMVGLAGLAGIRRRR